MKALKRITALMLVLLVLSGTCALCEEGGTDAGLLDASELDALVEDARHEIGISDDMPVSVAYCYTSTEELYYYNADEWYEGASLYKLPMIMTLANMQVKGTAGEIEAMYKSEGIEKAKYECLAHSNNTYALALADNFFPREYRREYELEMSGMTMDEMPPRYTDGQLFSARFMMGIMRTLYYNQEDYPMVVEYMCDAEPGKYLRTRIEDEYTVAQKYGATKNSNHIAGIVYTPTPFIAVVMTGYLRTDVASELCGAIGERLVQYTLSLDEAYQAEQERLAREIETPAPTPTPTPVPTPVQTPPQPTEPVSEEHSSPALLIVIAVAAAGAAATVFIVKRKTE